MSETKFIYPACYRIVRREIRDKGGCWCFSRSKIFYNPLNLPIEDGDFSQMDVEALFGTTKAKVVTELFRINGGKVGYYLVDLLDKQYYYCGATSEDVRHTLFLLGIGRPDPMKI
jgi:hypothetical protein